MRGLWTLTDVTQVIPFSGNRVSFNIVDGNGNAMNVSDRFLAQKLNFGLP